MIDTLYPGLGRRQATDPQDFLLRRFVSLPAVTRRNRQWPFFYQTIKQGSTGTCVEHGWRHFGMCAPMISTKRLNAVPHFGLYREMVLIDEWADNDYEAEASERDLQAGTSVRAGAKVFQKRGWIDHYAFERTLDGGIDWVCEKGPLVTGINWYSGMFEADRNRFIAPTGRLVGGHCICWNIWSEKRGAAAFLNSWESMPRFWILGEHLERLIREDGDLCTAIEIASV